MKILLNLDTNIILLLLILLMSSIPYLTKITTYNRNTYSNFILGNILYVSTLSLVSYFIYYYNKNDISFNLSNYDLCIYTILTIITIIISLLYIEFFNRENVFYLLPLIPSSVILINTFIMILYNREYFIDNIIGCILLIVGIIIIKIKLISNKHLILKYFH
jgi:uncharacterized membrane protein